MFKPYQKYTRAEIERMAGAKMTHNVMSYGVIYSVLDSLRQQYDFALYPYNDGDGLILIAVDGEIPQGPEVRQ